MERRSLDIKSISCNGVKSLALFQKPSLFAAVSVTSPSIDSKRRQQKKTPVDHAGGENPEWDHPMRFDDLDGQDLVLEFDLMASGNLFGDKLVGKAKVPVNDLLTEGVDGSVRHVSYQVTAPDGKHNGVIRFSYKISYPEVKLPAVTTPTNDYVYYNPSPAPYQVASLRAPNDYCCPPPPPREQAMSSPVSGYGYYPPSAPDVPSYYPSQPPDAGFYPPPPPPVHVECYPPPASFYPPAPPPPAYDPYGYRPESWDRGLYYR